MKQLRSTLLLTLTALIWGTAFVAQSVGADHVGTFTFLATRSWLGGLVLLPVIALLDRSAARGGLIRKPQTAGEKKSLLLGGASCGAALFLASAAQQAGVAQTTTAKAGFITTMYVVIVPILSIFLGKKVRGRIWLCVVLGVAGLYLLCMGDGLSLSPGDSMVLLCALLFSFHILIIDHFSPRMDGVRLSCLQFFVCAILSTVCMLLFEAPTWEGLFAAALPILYAGVMSSGVGYTLQIVSQKGLNPTVASLIMCLESVFSALAGWVILHQALSLRELGGCALMFVAIIITQLPDKKAPS